MIDSLLSLDTDLLIRARSFLGPEYSLLIQIFGESVVLWGGIFLVGLWLYGVRKKDDAYKVNAMMIFSTVILTFLLYTIINFGFDKWRPSPQEVVSGIAPLIPHPLDNSFPSGHALFTGAYLIGLFAFARYRYVILVTIIFGIITALSRVVGGVHYPGDIIGGWIFGIIGGIIFIKIVNKKFFQKNLYAHIIHIAKYFHL